MNGQISSKLIAHGKHRFNVQSSKVQSLGARIGGNGESEKKLKADSSRQQNLSGQAMPEAGMR